MLAPFVSCPQPSTTCQHTKQFQFAHGQAGRTLPPAPHQLILEHLLLTSPCPPVFTAALLIRTMALGNSYANRSPSRPRTLPAYFCTELCVAPQPLDRLQHGVPVPDALEDAHVERAGAVLVQHHPPARVAAGRAQRPELRQERLADGRVRVARRREDLAFNSVESQYISAGHHPSAHGFQLRFSVIYHLKPPQTKILRRTPFRGRSRDQDRCIAPLQK